MNYVWRSYLGRSQSPVGFEVSGGSISSQVSWTVHPDDTPRVLHHGPLVVDELFTIKRKKKSNFFLILDLSRFWIRCHSRIVYWQSYPKIGSSSINYYSLWPFLLFTERFRFTKLVVEKRTKLKGLVKGYGILSRLTWGEKSDKQGSQKRRRFKTTFWQISVDVRSYL